MSAIFAKIIQLDFFVLFHFLVSLSLRVSEDSTTTVNKKEKKRSMKNLNIKMMKILMVMIGKC